ncbi:MAG TPA: type II/IV secretion system ATPase subunit [Dehalococcoidia bacterium]|nr:type II/IV secretion system ATPase subunit [Dehalococcoidia bacterium]
MSETATRKKKRPKPRPEVQTPPPPEDPKAEMLRALHEASAAHPHLAYYLAGLDLGALGGEPDFYEKADRKAGEVKFKNFIYAVGGGLFVHIISDPEDARDSYASIEPSLGESDLSWISTRIDTYLLDYVDELEGCEDDDQKAEVLLKAVDDHVKVHGKRRSSSGGGGKSFLPFGRKKKNADGEDEDITVTPEELDALKYVVLREKIGLGPLQPLIQDPNIEDISCSGVGAIFIEHKLFGGLKSNITFDETEALDDFVLRLSEKIKKPVTYKNPISDATLPDGSRINIVYGNDVSTRGSNFTIRKFTAVPLSILDIIASGGISSEMAAYLSMIIGEGLNLFVSGETASGKTTLLNALTAFYIPSGKIVTIEDTPELQVPHANWTREVVRGSMSAADGGGVTMFSLLRAALRQRPNAILVGEIRGEEGAIAFQAMQTGHAVAATFHASSVEKLIQRLTGAPISVPKAYVDNLNVVCIASAVRLPNGRPGRRILSINELIGYDSAADAFSFIEVYRWVPHNDTFEATGHMNSYLLENRVAPARGIDPQNKRAIYDEMAKRARLFERLLEAGRTNFFDLYKAFAQAQRQGII